MDFQRNDTQNNAGDSTRIIINVGGFRHETSIATLQNIPDTRLAWIVENSSTSDISGPREYFFDRHPTAFAHVLNFYRTGKLHCPAEMCGPMYEEELKFWGVDEKQMEPCCWGKYTQHREAEENLKAFVGPGFEDLRNSDTFSSGLGSNESFGEGKWQRWQAKMWMIMDEPHSSRLAKVVSYMSCMFITVSIAIFCATTMPKFKTTKEKKYLVMGEKAELWYVEMICSIFFVIEFLMRLVLCPSKLRFIRGIMNWIDFISAIPFYLSLINNNNTVRMLVVVRILRLFRFIKLSYGLQVMIHTLKASSRELSMLFFMLLIPVVMFSSIMYYIEIIMLEGKSDFSSVPASFWWCLITMTTVGYGDMTPETWPGKVVGGACAICGVLIVALPISVIGSNFNLYYSHAQARLKLPVKQRRLVLGAVPGLLSKQQELSSRRKKKTKLSSGMDYELCTSDELSSSANSLQLQQRRTRSGFRSDQMQLGEAHEEAIKAALGSRDQPRESFNDDFIFQDPSSPDEAKMTLLHIADKPSDDEGGGGPGSPPLHVTVNPKTRQSEEPSPENLQEDEKLTIGLLNVANGVNVRKRSLSDSRLCAHREGGGGDTPTSSSSQSKDLNKNSMSNGRCTSPVETNKDLITARGRAPTFSSLPDYSKNRRKALSVAQPTSKSGADPDFMETKI